MKKNYKFSVRSVFVPKEMVTRLAIEGNGIDFIAFCDEFKTKKLWKKVNYKLRYRQQTRIDKYSILRFGKISYQIDLASLGIIDDNDISYMQVFSTDSTSYLALVSFPPILSEDIDLRQYYVKTKCDNCRDCLSAKYACGGSETTCGNSEYYWKMGWGEDKRLKDRKGPQRCMECPADGSLNNWCSTCDAGNDWYNSFKNQFIQSRAPNLITTEKLIERVPQIKFYTLPHPIKVRKLDT